MADQDNIERFLEKIRHNRNITGGGNRIFFSSSFLQKVGEIFEIHGFGATEVFLNGQERKQQREAEALRCLVQEFRSCNEIVNHRAIGRYIIKTLPTIIRGGATLCK